MGLNIRIHVGAYVVIKAPSIMKTVDVIRCPKPEHYHTYTTALYCPACGEKLIKTQIETSERATLYDLVDEEKYLDVLSAVDDNETIDYGGDLSGRIIAIGNRGNDGTSLGDIAHSGATINEIAPDMPARFIAAFNAEYADMLAVLGERATSVEVKFGVLTWWS